MGVCGYLYTPAYAPWPEEELAWLKAHGADPLWHDWGSRTYLEELLQGVASGSVHQVLLVRLADLGDQLDEVHGRLLQIQQAGVRLSLVRADGLQTPSTAGEWIPLLAEVPHHLQSRRRRQSQAQSRLAGKPPPGRLPLATAAKGVAISPIAARPPLFRIFSGTFSSTDLCGRRCASLRRSTTSASQ